MLAGRSAPVKLSLFSGRRRASTRTRVFPLVSGLGTAPISDTGRRGGKRLPSFLRQAVRARASERDLAASYQTHLHPNPNPLAHFTYVLYHTPTTTHLHDTPSAAAPLITSCSAYGPLNSQAGVAGPEKHRLNEGNTLRERRPYFRQTNPEHSPPRISGATTPARA